MAFTADSLKSKLNELDASQQSIQTVSTWCMLHKKHAKDIVRVWYDAVRAGNNNQRKLALMYLCNEIVQTSKKKTEDFANAFQGMLIPAFEHLFRHHHATAGSSDDDKLLSSVRRIVKVWSDRQVYARDFLVQLTAIADQSTTATPASTTTSASAPSATAAVSSAETGGSAASAVAAPSTKRLKSTVPTLVNGNAAVAASSLVHQHHKQHLAANNNLGTTTPSASSSLPIVAAGDLITTITDAYVEEEEAAVKDVDYDKIDADDVLRDIMRLYASLEHAATTDLQLRQRLTSFPKHLSDPAEAEKVFANRKITAAESVEADYKLLNEQMGLLKEFNNRLEAELSDRKQLVIKFKILAELHRRALFEADAKLTETKARIAKTKECYERVRAHVANLPDLSQLSEEMNIVADGEQQQQSVKNE